MEADPKSFDLEMKALFADDKEEENVHKTTGLAAEFSDYDPADLSEIRREIEVAKRLNHPNILTCRDVSVTDGRIRFEHADAGRSLAGYVVVSESELSRIVRQVLMGLGYLHAKMISHGDIKPSNIFVDSAGRVRVLYLGKILPRAAAEADAKRTGDIHDEFTWDLWSVGLCILKLIEGSLIPPSALAWRFLSCCMQTGADASNRWTVEELLRHPYFQPASVVPSKLKREFPLAYDSLIPIASEAALSYEAKQPSPRKKSKISLGVEQGMNKVGSSKDPKQIEIDAHVLRRCRQHCAMFLSDCEFEKDKLIQMWIAEECIEIKETVIMEDVANLYFDELVYEELITPSKFDHLYRQMKYKVNPSKISTWFLEQGDCIRIGEGDLDKIPGEALHIVWQCKRLGQTLVDALKNLKHLRTLLVHVDCSVLIKHLPSDTFFGLKLLRTLDLSCTHILELPGSIGLLEALRYLDISETPIRQLPQSITCLSFLQTLKLRGCFGLSALPKGLGRLINLRHLDLNIVGQLEFMPSGMGNLVKLQTLQAFIVGKNDWCGIGELENMNDITGSFCVLKLENVSSAEEAKKAALSNKKRIDKLELRWQDYGNDNSQDTTEILECLQPHFHLRELQITHYSGLKLSSWINNPSYSDLASITLYKCINCDILPSIGKLPSLKILHIVEMNNLKNINALVYRDYGIQGPSASVKVENAFPTLEKLTLEKMLNLEEWTDIEDGDFPCLSHISIRHCPKLSILPSLSYLCSLQHLEINHCMQLLSLPEGLLPTSVESLIIKGCPRLNERCLKDGGQDWFKIADVKNVWIDFEKLSLDKGM